MAILAQGHALGSAFRWDGMRVQLGRERPQSRSHFALLSPTPEAEGGRGETRQGKEPKWVALYGSWRSRLASPLLEGGLAAAAVTDDCKESESTLEITNV